MQYFVSCKELFWVQNRLFGILNDLEDIGRNILYTVAAWYLSGLFFWNFSGSGSGIRKFLVLPDPDHLFFSYMDPDLDLDLDLDPDPDPDLDPDPDPSFKLT